MLLVHAYDVSSLPPGARAESFARGRQDRKALLDKVAGTLTVPPSMHLDQLIEMDDPGFLLPRLSAKGELTVLGQDHPALSGQMSLGHVANTVATCRAIPWWLCLVAGRHAAATNARSLWLLTDVTFEHPRLRIY